MRGRVLDVGCGQGPGFPEFVPLYGSQTLLDGVDPFPNVHRHPSLSRRWQGTLESVPLEAGFYDCVFAIFVIEHLANPGPFLTQVARVLKPGGRFFAITPSATHPFAKSTLLVQALRMKERAAQGHQGLNHYPAHYRCNSLAQLRRLGAQAGFARGEVTLCPGYQWRGLVPAPLRPLAWTYDRVLASRVMRLRQLLWCMLEVPGQWQGPGPPLEGVPAARPFVLASA